MSFVQFDPVANFAATTITTAPSPATTGTSCVVTSGAVFPTIVSPATGFSAVIWPSGSQPTAANSEIVRVTAISTNTLTITRAQEGTAAISVATGYNIAANITAKTITDLQSLEGSSHSVQVINTAFSTTTTAATATGLTFNIGANQVFTFDAEISTKSSVTTPGDGVKFSIGAPTGASGSWGVMGSAVPTSSTNTGVAVVQFVTTALTSATMLGATLNASTVSGMAFIQGNIVNGATAGTVQLYYASQTTAAAQTINAGSNMIAFRLK